MLKHEEQDRFNAVTEDGRIFEIFKTQTYTYQTSQDGHLHKALGPTYYRTAQGEICNFIGDGQYEILILGLIVTRLNQI